MRKLFAVVLFALLLGVGVVAVIETDPGYVLVSYGNYSLETSLWVGLLLILLLVLTVYLQDPKVAPIDHSGSDQLHRG
jgi:HemY protein